MGRDKRSRDRSGSASSTGRGGGKRQHLELAQGNPGLQVTSGSGSARQELFGSLSLGGPGSSAITGPDNGLWFHRLGPNLENRSSATLLAADSAVRPATTPLDFSRLGQDAQESRFPVPADILEHFKAPANEQLLTELSGAAVAWDFRSCDVILRGSAAQLNVGKRLVLRVVTHCQWGTSEGKVRRLLSPGRLDTVTVRLAPMGISLRSVEKTLSLRNPTLSLGKDKTSDGIITDANVSRRHCILELDCARGAVYAIDCSTNGTFLNGKRLPQKKHGKVLLSHGDELLLKDPSQDSEFGYMVNLLDANAQGMGHDEDNDQSIGREFAETLRRRRAAAST